MTSTLCPTQQHAFDQLMQASSFGHLQVVFGNTGVGKSKVLEEAYSHYGGRS